MQAMEMQLLDEFCGDIGAERPAAGTTRRRQPEQIRARILKSALNIFATHGFEGTSVRSIAKDARVSISLLIYHFGSKEDLWRSTLEEIFKEAIPDIAGEDAVDGSSSAGDRLAAFIDRSVRLFAEFPALHRFMTLEGHQPTERLIWLCDTFLRDNFHALCALIAEAQREGAVVEGDPAQLRMAITAMAAVPFSVSAEYQYLTRHNPFARSEVDAIAAMIKRLVFRDGR